MWPPGFAAILTSGEIPDRPSTIFHRFSAIICFPQTFQEPLKIIHRQTSMPRNVIFIIRQRHEAIMNPR